MNKTAIKNFAVKARQKLMADVRQKAYELGIEDTDRILSVETIMDGFRVVGRNNAQVYKKQLFNHRERLIKEVEHKGLEQVVEEVAYTWFNRFIALRFMEVNGYLPTGVRVLSSTTPGKTEPDIIQEALNIDLDLNKTRIYELQDTHDAEELYRYLLVKQCNKLSEILPRMFERIDDFTELLLPDYLLKEGSVIRELVESIEEDDFHEQVEIIGWLYQYYISEKKKAVFAALNDNIKITKENIPAATQLFTPKWIVKYMVENSLGKLWIESHPEHADLKENWKYFIEEAEQEPAIRERLNAHINKNLNPEEITLLDPAMGSGHILVYAFDVLYKIYLKAGYSDKEIPKLILEKNLYGLDIDDRAGQLAYFALMMKARSKNRRIFKEKIVVNVYSIQESNHLDANIIEILTNPKDTQLERAVHKDDISYIMDVFQDAKDYGSILNVRKLDFNAIELRIQEVKETELPMFGDMVEALVPFLEQAKLMSLQFDIVVTNPPYMGRKGMNAKLSSYIDSEYEDCKADLFAVFMESCFRSTKRNGFNSAINQHSWMFLSSYEELRKNMLSKVGIQSMIHLGPRAFEEIGGEVVQSTTYVFRKIDEDIAGIYFRVVDEPNAERKESCFLSIVKNENASKRYMSNMQTFSKISGNPIAYWITDNFAEKLSVMKKLTDFAEPKQGMATCDNNRFLRYWHEVRMDKIKFDAISSQAAKASAKKWFPYHKGGEYRKWYGNNFYIVNWENDGQEIKEYTEKLNKERPGGRVKNQEYYFRKGLTWSALSSGKISFRYFDEGFLFDTKGSVCFFFDESKIFLFAGLLNSTVVDCQLKFLAPTLDFNPISLRRIAVEINIDTEEVEILVKNLIRISKEEWDSYEMSWDFTKNAILNFVSNDSLMSSAYLKSKEYAQCRDNEITDMESKINGIFAEAYGLNDETTIEISEEKTSEFRLNATQDIVNFISYSVGCMFGRYSIDVEGIVFAGGKFDIQRYVKYIPTESNVLPIIDEDYFEDDITNRFVEFVKAVFGENDLQANLTFISEKLGIKAGELPKDTIRRYFIKEFYTDHVKLYKNRPIYWQFDSGKQNGFKALIYMHRYDENTVARVRTEYLHELQKRYEGKVRMLKAVVDSDASARDKVSAQKQMDKIAKQHKECLEYDMVIAHVANQRITIDLDDGVKVNYAKFQNIEVSAGEGKKAVKANLLTPIKL